MALGMTGPNAEVRAAVGYRVVRAGCAVVAFVAVVWWLWQVWLTYWRPWEGRGGALDGVSRTEQLTGPVAGYQAPDSGAQLIALRGADGVVLSFRGAYCNERPASVRALYRPDSIVVSVDPDPRGCRDHRDEGPDQRDRVLLVSLVEPVQGRQVTVRCVGSSRCGPALSPN